MDIHTWVTGRAAARSVAAFLSALFIGIVLIERAPGVMVATDVPFEYLMFGTFKISLIDDITHAISGILGILALVLGYRYTVKYLLLVGGYYALDALFSVVFGVLAGQRLIENFLLNGPHIGITILVIFALLVSVKRIELN